LKGKEGRVVASRLLGEWVSEGRVVASWPVGEWVSGRVLSSEGASVGE